MKGLNSVFGRGFHKLKGDLQDALTLRMVSMFSVRAPLIQGVRNVFSIARHRSSRSGYRMFPTMPASQHYSLRTTIQHPAKK